MSKRNHAHKSTCSITPFTSNPRTGKINRTQNSEYRLGELWLASNMKKPFWNGRNILCSVLSGGYINLYICPNIQTLYLNSVHFQRENRIKKNNEF